MKEIATDARSIRSLSMELVFANLVTLRDLAVHASYSALVTSSPSKVHVLLAL